MPCDAFNGSLVEQCICSDAGIQEVLELKWRITSIASIVSVLHLPDVSGIAETRTLIGMHLSFGTYNFLYLKLTQKLMIYQIYVDCEHLLNSNLNMALLLSVSQNRLLTPKFLIELSACWKSFKSLIALIEGELIFYFVPLWTNGFI